EQKLEAEYTLAGTPDVVSDVVAAARAAGAISLRVEGSHASPLLGDVVGIALAVEPGRAWYLPLRHRAAGMLALDGLGVDNLPALDAAAMRPLVELLEDADVAKTGHDLKH